MPYSGQTSLLFGLLYVLMISCTIPDRSNSESSFVYTTPVVFETEIPPQNITIFANSDGKVPDGMAHVRLQISNIPNLFEHRSFTLIGGGLDQKGFHGEHASGFTGIGVHFAKIAGESSPNPIRTPEYKKDYTRPVTNGVLVFDMYYEPTDITIWGERYPTGSNLALTLMPKGGTERVMHAGNNPFNWSFGGISIGKSVTILLEIP